MAMRTPSQTIGPFFHEGLKWASGDSAAHRTVQVSGIVTDRDGKPANDVLLEIWQPDAAHRFGGLQRTFSDDEGRFAFLVAHAAGRTSHADVMVFARGLLSGLLTRVYVSDGDASAIELPTGVHDTRRATLIARRLQDGRYEWNIRLQGDGETVFFTLE